MGVADTLNCNIFIVNFIITNRQATHPIVHFHTLFSKAFRRCNNGNFITLTLLTGIAGINVYIVRILKLPFDISLHFYFFFFVGVIITGILKCSFIALSVQVFRYIGIVSLTICKHPLDYSGKYD